MQYWAACHIDNRLYRFEALPCDCVAMGLDIGSNMDSLSNYFCRLSDCGSCFPMKKKIRAPFERRYFEEIRIAGAFSFLFNRTGQEPLAVLA